MNDKQFHHPLPGIIFDYLCKGLSDPTPLSANFFDTEELREREREREREYPQTAMTHTATLNSGRSLHLIACHNYPLQTTRPSD